MIVSRHLNNTIKVIKCHEYIILRHMCHIFLQLHEFLSHTIGDLIVMTFYIRRHCFEWSCNTCDDNDIDLE